MTLEQPRAANPGTVLVAMTGIGKSFSGIPVLENVTWTLRPGEVHILAGENGAGKTTLIKILAGVYTDYLGEIQLHGRRARFRHPHDAARHGISAIHQDIAVVPSMNIRDNLFLGREVVRGRHWLDVRAEQRRARDILRRLGLDLDPAKALEDFPVSIRQMIEIAKALVNDAKVIVMDEPTSALNEAEAGRLFEIIQGLKSRGCAIVFISHRLEEIYRIGDRISVLRDGSLVGTFEARALSPERLVELMVGRDMNRHFPRRAARPGKCLLRVENVFVPDPLGIKPWAVEEAGFELREGEILGVAGLQGSGKSELFHGIFGGLGRGVQGRISLDGSPYVPRSPRAAIRRGLVLVTNDRKTSGLVPTMSIAGNVSLAVLGALSSRAWVEARREGDAARRSIDAFSIKARSAEQDVGTLSGGNQQKVILARWIETRPKVLLLDEPTIGIDVGAKNEIYHLLNAWTSDRKGILLITSELPELLSLSDRILVMHRGRIMAEFDRSSATPERVIRAAMGKEELP
jgi:ABC-type sugar transport system ATPase subunit